MGITLLVSEHSHAELLASPKSLSKTGPVLPLSMMRLGAPLSAFDVHSMDASIFLHSCIRLGSVFPVLSMAPLESLMALHCLGKLGLALPIAKEVQAGFPLLAVGISLLGVSVSIRSFKKFGLASFVAGSTCMDLFPLLRQPVCMESSPPVLSRCNLDVQIPTFAEAHLETLPFLRALTWTFTGTLAPTMDSGSLDTFLPLQGFKQMGVQMFAFRLCCSGPLLPAFDAAFLASALLLKSSSRIETLVSPAGLSCIGSVFTSLAVDVVAIDSSMPLRSPSRLGFLLSMAAICHSGSSLTPRHTACSGFLSSASHRGSIDSFLPALDLSLDSFFSVQGTSQLDVAPAAHWNVGIESLMLLQALSHSGTSLPAPGAKRGSLILLASFGTLGSTPPSQDFARIEAAALVLDFSTMDFLLSSQSLSLGKMPLVLGTTRVGSPPSVPDFVDFDLLLLVQGLACLGSKLFVTGVVMLDLLLLLKGLCESGFLTFLSGTFGSGLPSFACGVTTLGFPPVTHSFVRLNASMSAFDFTRLGSLSLLQSFLQIGPDPSTPGSGSASVQTAAADKAFFPGSTLPSRSYLCSDLPMFTLYLGHFESTPSLQSAGHIDSSALLPGNAIGRSISVFGCMHVDFLSSSKGMACLGFFVSASCLAPIGSSLPLQSFHLDSPMSAPKLACLGLPASAVGASVFGFSLFLRSLG